MSKSKMTVTMPMTEYERLIECQKELLTLKTNLTNCFKANNSNLNILEFNVNEALKIIKNLLSMRYRDFNVDIIST
jgi:hypothetical protein